MDARRKKRLGAAVELYRAGRFHAAEQLYLELHQLDPEDSGVLLRLGELALWNNRGGEADRYLQGASRHASWPARKWPLNAQLNEAWS